MQILNNMLKDLDKESKLSLIELLIQSLKNHLLRKPLKILLQFLIIVIG